MADVDTDVSLLSEETCLVASDECRQGKRGHGTTSRREDQQARYWSYLFDNLHRVVDEIYCTCEADRNVVECEGCIQSVLDVINVSTLRVSISNAVLVVVQVPAIVLGVQLYCTLVKHSRYDVL